MCYCNVIFIELSVVDGWLVYIGIIKLSVIIELSVNYHHKKNIFDHICDTVV